MEKGLSVLIADLTGYTAMAEVHGGRAAVCVMEKFVSLIEKSLVGQARLVKRIGDQVMIVSESPDDLAKTVIRLYKSMVREPGFLPIHAGLHHGLVYEQYGTYYGSAVNIAAKMAAKAGKGKLLASVDFIHSLQQPQLFQYIPFGLRHFKKVKDIGMVELIPEVSATGEAIVMNTIHTTQLSTKDKKFINPYSNSGFLKDSKTCLDTFRQYQEQLVLS